MAPSWARAAYTVLILGFFIIGDCCCNAATTSSTPTTSKPVPTYTWTQNTVVTNCPIYQSTTSLAKISVTTSSGAKPAFTALVASDGTVANQIVAADSQKNPILFQTSNSSQITLFLASKHRAIIDNNGARLFSNDCSSEFVLPVPNLLSDVQKYTSPSKHKPKRRSTRIAADAGTSIPLSVAFIDQCMHPVVNGHRASAQCIAYYNEAGGFKTSTKVALALSGNTFVGACAVPDPSADKKRCQDDIKAVLDYPTQGWFGQLTNLSGALGFISSVVRAGSIRTAAASAAAAFEIPEIALALGALSLFELAVQAGLDTAISNAVCSAIGAITLEVDAALDAQPQQSIAFEGTAPLTGVTVTRTVSISTITCSSSTTHSSSSTSATSSTSSKSTSQASSTPTNILINGGFSDSYLNGYYYINPWILCNDITNCPAYTEAQQDPTNSSNYNMDLTVNYQVPYDYIYQSAPNPFHNATTSSSTGLDAFLLKYRYLPYGANPGDVRSLAAIVGTSTIAAQTFTGFLSETPPYTTFTTQFNYPRSEPSLTLTMSLGAVQTTMGGNVFLDDITIAPIAAPTQAPSHKV